MHSFIDILISIVLSLIMFGIGMSLKVSTFKEVFIYPKAILVGLAGQIILLPIISILLVLAFDLPPEIQIGFIILASCPGGTTSNFITFLLKGNTALSIAMTSINSIITLVSIPIFVNTSLGYFFYKSNSFNLPYLDTLIKVFLITIIPVIVGMVIAAKSKSLSLFLNQKLLVTSVFSKKKLEVGMMKSVTLFLLALVFLVKLFAGEETGGINLTYKDVQSILPVAIGFNIAGLLTGLVISKINKLNKPTSMTISIEVGLQNTTLAFLIAGTFLKNVEMQKPALIYALFSFWTTLLFGLLVRYAKFRSFYIHKFQ